MEDSHSAENAQNRDVFLSPILIGIKGSCKSWLQTRQKNGMGDYNFQFDWKIHLSSNKTSLHQNPTPGSVLLHLHVWDDYHPWTSCQCCSAGRLCQQEGAISSHYFILYKNNIAEAALHKLPGTWKVKFKCQICLSYLSSLTCLSWLLGRVTKMLSACQQCWLESFCESGKFLQQAHYWQKNLKIDAIYAFYTESFCAKNLAIQKVFAFSDSAARAAQNRAKSWKGMSCWR